MPQHDAATLFEFLTLEGAQAGLSWSTILAKRDGYRRAFAGFDPAAVAAFGDADIERCMGDPGIVRNRAKITATIGNARAWLDRRRPGRAAVVVRRRGAGPATASPRWRDLPASDERSAAMSKELKRRGFRFVGPTICYALMQACGMVNDHVVECFRHAEVAALP